MCLSLCVSLCGCCGRAGHNRPSKGSKITHTAWQWCELSHTHTHIRTQAPKLASLVQLFFRARHYHSRVLFASVNGSSASSMHFSGSRLIYVTGRSQTFAANRKKLSMHFSGSRLIYVDITGRSQTFAANRERQCFPFSRKCLTRLRQLDDI